MSRHLLSEAGMNAEYHLQSAEYWLGCLVYQICAVP